MNNVARRGSRMVEIVCFLCASTVAVANNEFRPTGAKVFSEQKRNALVAPKRFYPGRGHFNYSSAAVWESPGLNRRCILEREPRKVI